jgi:hypothetical protein
MGEDEVKALFLLAGIRLYSQTPIPNGYDRYSGLVNGPWWECQTRAGKITIGWRKRVIEITWHSFVTSDDEPVTRDQVTIGNNYVHAYSNAKAVEYLDAIKRAFERAEYLNKLTLETTP